jgi:hypothetical protein
MRVFLTALLALVVATVCVAADLSIIRVWPGYRTAESFERISQYLGKDENLDSEHILRTTPAVRAGYYFLLRINNSGAATLTDAKIELQVITPFSPEPKTYNFAYTVPTGSHALNLGLTGADWPGKPKDEVVAWHLRVLSATGAELVKAQSHLWSLPDKK